MQTEPLPIPALANRCVLVDGPARTGKFLLSNLIGNLEGVEYVNHVAMHENIGLMHRMGHIDRAAALAQLRLTINVAIYERSIGRHLNTRPTDKYSIFNSLKVADALARTTRPDGPDAIAEYLASGILPMLLTHDTVPNIDLFFDAQPGLKTLLLLRHPVDIIASWWRRGWGERFGIDPLAVTACAATPYGPCPWWAVNWAEAYAAMTPLDRCLRGVMDIYRANEDALGRLPAERRQRVRVVTFETLATDTMSELTEIADFLGAKVSDRAEIVFTKERVPRTLDPADRRSKLSNMKAAGASPELLEQLHALSSEYEGQYLSIKKG
jgi:hypothetical protein